MHGIQWRPESKIVENRHNYFKRKNHGYPVNGVLNFGIMLFFIDKSRKMDVTDLIFLSRKMREEWLGRF